MFWQIQVPLVASNRIGKEIIQTEHGNSEITFYGNSFIAGIQLYDLRAKSSSHMNEHETMVKVNLM